MTNQWKRVASLILIVLLGVSGLMPVAPGGGADRAYASANAYIISTVAGNGTQGDSGDGDQATSATMFVPYGVALDNDGNLYIADRNNNRLRKVDAATGIISEVLGPSTVFFLQDVAVDNDGNIYVADTGHHKVLKMDTGGTVTTVAGNGIDDYTGDDGPATSASLNAPGAVALDSAGNLYIADTLNSVVRRVDATTGMISTFAGDGSGGRGDGGPATEARLSTPYGLAFDGNGDLYIADLAGSVRKVDMATTIISTYAGTGTRGYSGDGGPADEAQLDSPIGIVFDGEGNLYISEISRIRRVDPAGTIRTIAGTGTYGYSGDGSEATAAELGASGFITVDGSGNLFFSDPAHHVVRKLAPAYVMFFESNGGSAVTNEVVVPGDTASEPADPVKTGHTFGGWYADAAWTTPFDFSTAIHKDWTLHAKWTPIPYTVTFDKNGGDTEASPSTMTVNYGSSAGTLPTEPSRSGYKFNGWKTTADGSGTTFLSSTVVTGDLTVYAQWLPAGPDNLKAVPADGQVTLTWDRVAEATLYGVFMRTESGAYGQIPPVTVTDTVYTATGLTNGATYYFTVAAFTPLAVTLSQEVSATPGKVTLSDVRLTSDNPAAGWARTGNAATLAFTASEALGGLPSVTIAGRPAGVTDLGGNRYQAVHPFDGSESEGPVLFAIDFTITTGAVGATVTATTDGSGIRFDKTAPVGSLSINEGAATTSSASVALGITSSDGTGSGDIRMRFSNDNVTWSAWEPAAPTRAWTLTEGDGKKTVYMELSDLAGNVTQTAIQASISLRTSTGTRSGSHTAPGLTVDLVDGKEGSVVETAVVARTIDSEGRYTDRIALTAPLWERALGKLEALNSDYVKIVIPDDKGMLKELDLTISKEAAELLSDSRTHVELVSEHARIDIPHGSFKGATEDLKIRLVPILKEEERKAVESQAATDPVTLEAADGAVVDVIARPVVIESNMTGESIDVRLPLDAASLNGEPLVGPAVFVLHGDGTKELVQGEIVDFDQTGTRGIRISVRQFSTFTGLNLRPDQLLPEHIAYMRGYVDGTFRPDRNLTRAEMATILSRVVDRASSAEEKTYTDIPEGYWATDAIDKTTGMGLMIGYPDGSFKPDAPITRAEMTSAIDRLLDSRTPDGTGFPDTMGSWAEASIRKAQAAGIVTGYEDGMFRPHAKLTRAEAVAMINRMLGRGPLYGAQQMWTDVPQTHWAFGNIQEASIDHLFEARAEGGESYVPAPPAGE